MIIMKRQSKISTIYQMNIIVLSLTIFLFIGCLCLVVLASFDYFGLVMAVLPLLIIYVMVLYDYKVNKANVIEKTKEREREELSKMILQHDRLV